jgi:hypothetical protein
MSDQYTVTYMILTNFLPQILFAIFFPFILFGVAFKLMRNPAK